VHLWTNSVRVEPEAFQSYFNAGGCSFEEFPEVSKQARAPYRWHLGLNEVARLHSEDMRDNSFFSHDSSDGTPFAQRVSRYYSSSYIGENIAMGYPDPQTVVLSGWMCSDKGHREAIMSPDFVDLGVGVADLYYTQDFGSAGDPARMLSMGLHLPERPNEDVSFRIDFSAATAPDALEVVYNGAAYPLDTLLWGVERQGIYEVDVPVEAGEGCHTYWFRAEAGGQEVRFPEAGSYGWGDCAWDDAPARWVLDQPFDDVDVDDGKPGRDRDPGLFGADDLTLAGCATVPGTAGAGALILLALLSRRGRSRQAIPFERR
jgi:hypothetical protein